MVKNRCIECDSEVGNIGTYCSNCGKKVEPYWVEIHEADKFLKTITKKDYIKDCYWNDDYSGFIDKWGNTYYCGYESKGKLEINGVQIIGVSNTLKWYEQFAPKEAVDYHFNCFPFMKKLFAGLALMIQINENEKL